MAATTKRGPTVRDLAERAERLRRLYGDKVPNLDDAEARLDTAAGLDVADDPHEYALEEALADLEYAAGEARRDAAFFAQAAREVGALARAVRGTLEAARTAEEAHP